MKRITTLIIVLILTTAITAKAFAPVVIPLWYFGASVALHLGGAAAGLYYAMKPGSSPTVDSGGNIKRPSGAVWIDTKDMSIDMKDLSAIMPLSKVRELANKNKSDNTPLYPGVNSAVNNSTVPYANVLGRQTPLTVGDTVKIDGLYYKIDSVTSPTPTSTIYDSQTSGGFRIPAFTEYNFASTGVGSDGNGGYTQFTQKQTVTKHAIATPPIVTTPKSDPEAIAGLADSGTSGPVKSSLQAELDKMFQDPDYVPTFSDDTTGLPYVPPPSSDVMSPEKLNAYNKAGAASDAQAAAQVAAAGSVAGAQGAVDQATAANNANPGNAGLQQALADAQSNLEKAKFDKVKLDADIANGEAEDAKGEAVTSPGIPDDNVYDVGIEAPAKKSIGNLLSGFFSNSPLAGLLRTFTIQTDNSSCVVAVGNVYGRELTFDFCRWQPFLSACGVVLLIISHAFAIKIVVKGW